MSGRTPSTTVLSRRQWLVQAALLLGAGRWTFAAAPCLGLAGETVTWIVPHAAGGGHDAYSRLIALLLAPTLDVKIFVRNQPASGGLIGARAIMRARPDGRTMGLVSGSGMLAASLAGVTRTPNPATAFTLLGRVAGSEQVWATGRSSSLRTMDDVFATSRTRPIVFGTRDVGGLSFVTMTLGSWLLGLPIEVVPGYGGTGEGVLAAVRGDVDLVSYDFDTIHGSIDSGELRPLLQIARAPVSSTPGLVGVPALGGRDGVAARRGRARRRTVDDVLADVDPVLDLINAGRLVVAPPRMRPALTRCLQDALMETLHDPMFRERARRTGLSLDVADAETARRRLVSASRHLNRFTPIIRAAIQKLRA